MFPWVTGFVHIHFQPDTADDFMEDNRADVLGADESTGASSFAARRDKDDVVALNNDVIFKRDIAGIVSVISNMREERGIAASFVRRQKRTSLITCVSVGIELASKTRALRGPTGCRYTQGF